MPVMDEFKEERDKILKEGTLKDKVNYLVYYYKWHVIAAVLIAWFVISLVVTIVTHKEPGFYSVIVNGTQLLSSDTYAEEFGTVIGIDPEKEEVILESDLYLNWETNDEMTASNAQKIAVYVSAGDLDTIVSDLHAMNYYGYNDIIMDVREYLSPDLIELYEPYFYYVDRALIEAKKAADEAGDYSFTLEYPDNPYDPTKMTDPVPVAINVKEITSFTNHFFFKKESLFGVFKNTSRLEQCVEFLEFMRNHE